MSIREYELVVRGVMGERSLRPVLDDFRVERTAEGDTRLVGPVRDASQLHGLVSHLTSSHHELVRLGPTPRSDREERIAALLRRADGDRRTGEVLWRVRTDDGAVDVTHGDPTRPFVAASTTKLLVTAILARLRVDGRLGWDDPVLDHLPELAGSGLLGGEVTIRQVMSHTAGLPDYFTGRRSGGSTFDRLRTADLGWSLDDVIAWSRELDPPRAGRARYSDTGYQLLGAVIERTTGRSFADAVRVHVAEPLGLTGTWCLTDDALDRFAEVASVRDGDRTFHVPRALASMQADGCLVSTLDDAATIVDALFDGRLLPPDLLAEARREWRRVYFPFEAGTGVVRLRLPRAMTAGRRLPELVGHPGATGVLWLRAPALGLTLVGTVNQIRHPSLATKLALRVVREVGGAQGPGTRAL